MSPMSLEPRRVLGMPHRLRNELVAGLTEFVGTFMFLLFSFAAAQAVLNTSPPDSKPGAATLFYISAGFGCSLAVNVWAFYRVSGGMFNPAVTLALVLVRVVKPLRGLIVVIAQIVAGIAAAALTDGLIPGPLTVAVRLGENVSVVQGLFIEVFTVAQLVIAVLMLAVEKHRATFLAPLGIGLALFIAHLVAVPLTGAGVNPSRAFGPAVITGFHGYHWIYWVGPALGSLLACAVWGGLIRLRYWTVNEGQDDDGLGRRAEGWAREMANGKANGTANGTANGSANGTASGMGDGGLRKRADGWAREMANGSNNGTANGTANGAANGAAYGTANAV